MPSRLAHRAWIQKARHEGACEVCRADLSRKVGALGPLAERLTTDLHHHLSLLLASLERLGDPTQCRPLLMEVMDGLLQTAMDASSLHQRLHAVVLTPPHDTAVPLDLTSLVRDSLRILEGHAPTGMVVKSRLASGIWVTGVATHLQQALMNVAINGMQAMGTSGTLLVSLEERVLDAKEAHAQELPPGRYADLAVQDQGPGIPADLLPRIFDPYVTTHAQQGRGLGLTQARAILLRQHGQLTVASSPGQGATFHMLIPCSSPAAPTVETHPSVRLQGTERILFLDRDPLTRDLARFGLESLGYHVDLFEDPVTALEEVKQHPAFYDAVVFELLLPRMGGMDLAHRLRHVRKDLPLILLTDMQVPAEPLLRSHTELSAVLGKPFTVPDLADCLRQHFQRPLEVAVPLPAPKDPEHRRCAVLLAEDSTVTRGMIRTWLAPLECKVHEARDGEAAWELYRDSGTRFDLVLTDVVMPRMDGLELAKRIREADAAVPLVIMTTVEDRETVKAALQIGVNDFLNKPFEKEVLLECVQRQLSNTGQRAEARRSVETAQAVRMAQRALLAVAEKDLPLYTLYEALTDAGGDVFRASRLPDGQILFVLGDVAGHSVLSSYAVASFLGMLSTFTDSSSDLGLLAQRLNQGIQDGPFSEVPVCTLLGLWHPDTGRVQLLNAGIPYGILFRASTGSVEEVPLNGTPLGILPDPPMDRTILNLHPGDRMLFGTDGFFEVLSSDGRPFQPQVLQQWGLLKDTPVQWALSLICEAARAHGDGVLSDDMLVLGFEQGARSAPSSEFLRDFKNHASQIDNVILEFKSFLEASETGQAFTADRRFEIVLALREALTNAVIHGNQDHPEARVSFHASFVEGGSTLRVRVADEGPGFSLEQHQPPRDIDSDRGRGIPLIRHFAQAVSMVGSELSLTFTPEGPCHDDSRLILGR